MVEVLVVVAVIAILAVILVPQISGVIQTSQVSVARQQQAELQSSLGNWIVARSSGPGGLAAARTAYTGTKLSLLENYLQASTFESLTPDGDKVHSGALDKANAYLQFSPWTASDEQPIVEWKNQ